MPNETIIAAICTLLGILATQLINMQITKMSANSQKETSLQTVESNLRSDLIEITKQQQERITRLEQSLESKQQVIFQLQLEVDSLQAEVRQLRNALKQ